MALRHGTADAAIIRLAGARLRHIAGSHWSTRKYMNMTPLFAEQTSTSGAAA